MTIYIDVVLIENLVMNTIILFATAIILRNKIKILRILIASSIGAIYSIMAYSSNLEIYTNMILKIILSIVMIYIAYNPQNVKQLWKQLLIFYLTSFAFGGAAFAFIYIVKPQEILMKNGLFLGLYPLQSIVLGVIIAFAIIISAFTIVKSKLTKKDIFVDIKIKFEDGEVETKAMIDTGNMLKEPISSTPVVVVEHTLLYECIPKEILDNLEKILGGDFEKIPEDIKEKYISKLKLIPFSSLGKQNGMLLGIKPQFIKIENEEEKIETEKVIIGIYKKSLTKRGEYRALLGMELMEENQ